jgi:hypothetical protein
MHFKQNTQLWGSGSGMTVLLLPLIDPYGFLFVIIIPELKDDRSAIDICE